MNGRTTYLFAKKWKTTATRGLFRTTPDITRELYLASRAGVRVALLIRDTCRLRPGIPGLSENIRVISIVSRFLEHSRIYYFRNAGHEEYYIGSADSMMRNLEHRVEVLVPVEETALQAELRQIIDLHLADQRSAWDMQPDGTYVQRRPSAANDEGCQEQLIAAAQRRHKEAKRLKRRKPSVMGRRNVRLPVSLRPQHLPTATQALEPTARVKTSGAASVTA